MLLFVHRSVHTFAAGLDYSGSFPSGSRTQKGSIWEFAHNTCSNGFLEVILNNFLVKHLVKDCALGLGFCDKPVRDTHTHTHNKAVRVQDLNPNLKF